jgi:hypothetical protein
MTRDALGHQIEFGTVARVGARRKDGRYPVSFVFKSSGRRINKILTADQLEEECRKEDVDVVGYRSAISRPEEKKSPAQLDEEIRQALSSERP